MILSDIKRYLQERKQATLNDIALHLDVDPEAVRGMLDQWIRKGKVIRTELGACSNGCASCGCDADKEIYHWKA